MNECLECGQKFDSIRSLHAHIKAHDLYLGEYYTEHFNKKDLFTGQTIPFKNYNQYFKDDFVSVKNFKQWLKVAPNSQTKEYVLNRIKKRIEEKDISFSPPSLYWDLSEGLSLEDIIWVFGSYENFEKELNLERVLKGELPENFWNFIPDLPIMIDTREQQPLEFENSFRQKLDFGDYTTNGQYYSKTFIERKSESDFLGTFSGGFDRFQREMDRCISFNSYMFIVVESSRAKTEENPWNRKINLEFVWHNAKTALTKYPKNLQIIFSQSRKGSKKLIPKILFYGEKLWDVDLQKEIELRLM